MADVYTTEKRSRVMASIRGRGNASTEQRLANLLRAKGITGWRRHYPVFGRPDFVFLKLRVAIFVDGCFWHSCPTHGVKPKGNSEFWAEKLSRNKTRFFPFCCG